MKLLILCVVLMSAPACGEDGGKLKTNSDISFTQADGLVVYLDTRTRNGSDSTAVEFECNTAQECPAGFPYCNYSTNSCVECKKNDHCTSPEKPYCNPASMVCVECIMDNHCPTEYQHCLDGSCSDKACFPGHAHCVGNNIHICSPDGMDPNWEVIECGDKKCVKGDCLECTPGETACKEKLVIKCADDGKSFEVLETCQGEKDCFGGQCLVCYPGDKRCEGNLAMLCNIEGSGWDVSEDCTLGGLTCYMGACLSPCAGDIKQNTNAGCEFYAVDLDNAVEGEYNAQNAQYAIIASNTSKDDPATVTVLRPDGNEDKQTIPPMSLHKFELPPTWGLDGTLKAKKAFRVTSTRPVIVYQFNPLSNKVEVFSNDASVLLPSPSLGNEYYVMTYGQYENTFRGYFTVIGISTLPTQVTFTPSTKTLAGGGIPALNKGESHTVLDLGQGEVLHVESNQSGGDLSGTHIVSNAPVAVFGGHEATNMLNLCCADHLEQQMMPVNTWGTHYLVSKTWERWKEQDHIRILAAQDGTNVTLNPAVSMVPELKAGQYHTFQSSVSLEITANKPVMVAQYLASSYEILGTSKAMNCSGNDCPSPFTCDYFSGWCLGPECSNDSQCPSGTTCDQYMGMGQCAPIGDPAMMLVVSEQQYMDSYVFLTPDAYVQDYLNVIAPMDAGKVVLDNNQINPGSFIPIGASGFGVYRTAVSDGVHSIWSDKEIGILVYGYDDDVSYGYPGGMGLVELDF